MNRLSPATFGLLVVAGSIFLADAIFVVAPTVLADPAPSAVASPTAASTDGLLLADIATPDPTAYPSLDPAWREPPLPTYTSPTPAPSMTRIWPSSAPTAKPTPAPPPRDTVWNARIYVQNRIGVRQYDCINPVWTAESKWNPLAGNPARAYGIPQANPGSKMAAFGSNWRYSPLIQVKWGIWYVYSRYGSACNAYSFWKAHGWY